jgi:hypothetical protein
MESVLLPLESGYNLPDTLEKVRFISDELKRLWKNMSLLQWEVMFIALMS